MAIKYPENIDDTVSLPKVTDGISPVVAADYNRLRDVIVEIESELGSNPSGTASTVKDRIQTIEDTVSALHTTTIGEAEDGDYTDGLYTDFTELTPIGSAVDRFNEFLSLIAPPAAPPLSSITYTSDLGVSAKLSFGASNTVLNYHNVSAADGLSALDINDTFPVGSGSDVRKGIYASGGSHSGEIAGSVAAGQGSPNTPYPAKSFGFGDSGMLQLFLNGAILHQVDLSSFSSGDSVNSNGSGFTDLSAAFDVKFPNGQSFDMHKYRTGNWLVTSPDQRRGFNYVQMKHVVGATTYTTNFFSWVNDDISTATTFSSEAFSSLSLTGSRFLSGVEYYTGGTVTYSATINNAYRNTYSSNSAAIYHSASSNLNIASSALSTMTLNSDTASVSKTATINAARLLGESLVGKTSVLRSVQATQTSTGATALEVLLDSVTETSTATTENFNGEGFRVPSNRSLSLTTGFLSTAANLWLSLNEISGAAGYSDGLLIYNGALQYPNNSAVIDSGDFSSLSNAPASNPDYSGLTGDRTYLRYFYFDSPAHNFILTIDSENSDFVSAVTSLTADNVRVELLAPNTTTGSGVEFKDCLTAYTIDSAIGCHAATFGSSFSSGYGVTIGSKSTATSGNAIIIRLTVGSSWSGKITGMSLTAI